MNDRQIWNKEIIDAERQRLQTPAAMDVMGTRKVAAGKDIPDQSQKKMFPGEEWIIRALSLEEKQ